MDPLLQSAVDRYLHLSSQPGWADYAIDQARELAKEHPAVFDALPKLLLAQKPSLSQVSLTRPKETKANTFRIPARYREHFTKEKK